MTAGQQALLGAGGAGVLLLTPQNNTVDNSFALAGDSAYFTFWPDGRVTWTLTGYGSDTFVFNWCSPVGVANGLSYSILFSRIAGSGPGGGAPDPGNLGPEGSWLSLASARSIGYSGLGPYRMASWNAQIARTPGTPLVTHRCNCTLWAL